MRRLFIGLAVAGLAGGAFALSSGVAARAATPSVTQCLPPAGQSVPAGTASGVILVLGEQGTSGTPSCSFTYTGSSAVQYGAATPNAFTITATHTVPATSGTCSVGVFNGTDCTVTDASASAAPTTDLQNGSPSSGDVTGTLTGAIDGDTITVTATLACAPGDPTGQGCGGIGTIAVGSPS